MLSARRSYNCAVRKDRSLWCWGREEHSQLGQGDSGDLLTPTMVTDLADVVEVATSSRTVIARTADGNLYYYETDTEKFEALNLRGE